LPDGNSLAESPGGDSDKKSRMMATSVHKESSGMRPVRCREQARESDQVEPGPVPGGTRPLRPHSWSPMYTGGSGTQDGVNLGTAVRRPARGRSERRRRTWTHTRPG